MNSRLREVRDLLHVASIEPRVRKAIEILNELIEADRGRAVPPHGSGPGGPSWQPPKGERIHQC
jgi:hypothetical protein